MTSTVPLIEITCTCGSTLNARLVRFRSGRDRRYIANCAECGRLLRKSLPEKVISLRLNREELQPIQIGSAFHWTFGAEGTSPRDDQLATAYHVEGLPKNVTANLIREPEIGYWTFVLHTQRRSIHSEWFCPSKEHALADLHSWLEARCLL